MNYGYVSLTGKVRDNDEDSVLVLSATTTSEGKSEGKFLGIVADGMGGGEYGEVASRIAVNTFRNILGPMVLRGKVRKSELRDLMIRSFEGSNFEILQVAKKHDLYLMGTTVTSLFLSGNYALIGNLGDSRTYVFDKDGNVKFKTKDHSYVQELVDSTKITQEDARSYPRRNELTRSLGIESECIPDFYEVEIEPGDSILLCCDGLWEAYSDEEMGKTITGNIPAQLLVDEIANSANLRDGSDNISLVLVKPQFY
jgi:protein phosphatase